MSLTACTVGLTRSPLDIKVTPIEETPSQTPIEIIQDTDLPADDLYFILTTPSPPFQYKLARLPVKCLLDVITCSNIEMIAGFPEVEYSPSSTSPLSWAPDGSQALFINSYSTQLLSFEPQDGVFRSIANDLNIITDRMVWSPDNHWIAVAIQGLEAYTGYIILINPENGERRSLTPIENDLIYFPLKWLNEKELVILAERYSLSGTSSKKIVTQALLYKVDIMNNSWVEMGQNINWAEDTPVLSPDGNLMAFSAVQENKRWLLTMKMGDAAIHALCPCGGQPKWSPNGEWIASVLPLELGTGHFVYDVYINHPNETSVGKIIRLDSYPNIVWLSDSKHIMVFSSTFDNESDIDKMTVFVFSTVHMQGNELAISEVIPELRNYSILGVSLKSARTP